MADIHDYGARLNRIVATGDRSGAATLLREVQAAMADGSARGFEGDMAKLASLAGVPLTKAAPGRAEPMQKGAERPMLPPHLRQMADEAVAKIEAASTPNERRLAKAHGLQVKQRLDDFWAGFGAQEAIRAIQARPKMTKAHV